MSGRDTDDEAPQYAAARLHEALAEDPRTAELGIKVTVRPGEVFLRGEVLTEGRRDRLTEVIGELAPDLRIHNEVRVADCAEPTGRETLR
jgi:osmotically-inducible protein OsmY